MLNLNKTALCLFAMLFTISSVYAQGNWWNTRKLSKSINEHNKMLVNDELSERTAGSAGENATAKYISDQMASIQLTPKGDQDYYQSINVPNLRMAQANNLLMIDKEVLTLFSDYYPVSASSNNGRYNGEAINVGYGIEDPGLSLSGYKDLDVKGKAVIMDVALPTTSDKQAKYASWLSVESRINYALGKGVKAVLLYSSKEEFKPSGQLEKVIENSNIPVFYVARDLSKTKTATIELNVDILILSTLSYNLVGSIDNNAKTTVYITTHHDNTYTNYEDLKDNSRSVATFLALAAELKKNSSSLVNNNYLFVSFTGEEDAMLGARHLTKSELMKQSHANYTVSLDNIKDLDSSKLFLSINGLGSSPWFATTQALTKPKGYEKLTLTDTLGASSAAPLYLSGTPVLSINANSIGQNKKKIKKGKKEAQLVSYLCQKIIQLDTASGKLGDIKTDEPVSRYPVIPYSNKAK